MCTSQLGVRFERHSVHEPNMQINAWFLHLNLMMIGCIVPKCDRRHKIYHCPIVPIVTGLLAISMTKVYVNVHDKALRKQLKFTLSIAEHHSLR